MQIITSFKGIIVENKERKTAQINIRLTEVEKEKIEKKAAAANMTVSRFLVQSATKKKVINHDNLLSLLREINRIGTNINQATRIMNTYHPDDTEDFEYIEKEFSKVKKLVMDYIGKEM